MGVTRILLVGLVALFTSGCFVLDELDAGEAIMDAHTSTENKKKAAAKKAAKEGGGAEAEEAPPTYSESVAGWFENASTLAPREKGGENPMVECEIAGKKRFTRRSDCVSQGGREV